MKLFNLFILLPLVVAFDCNVKELKDYDLSSIKGTKVVSDLKLTPPSKTSIDWYLGICEKIDNKEECEGSGLCGLTQIHINNQVITSQIMKIDSPVSYEPFHTAGDKGIILKYDEVKYGDGVLKAEVKLICDSPDEVKLSVDKWDGENLKLSVRTAEACVKLKKHKQKEDTGESWGWFTWIFIFFVLFLSIYIIGGAWFQYTKGNSIDFQTALKEVVENFVDILKGLPIFIREIIERFSNPNRGEYSAV